MRKVGQVLKEARIALDLSLEEVEKKTKIRKKTLLALEEGRYEDLPSSTYVKGLIKNYGQFLKLSGNSLLALYRREYKLQEPQTQSTFLALPFRFRLTPNLTVSILGVLAVLGLLCYIIFQYVSLVAAPHLSISQPKDFAQVSENQIEILGKTDSDTNLFVNGESVSLDEEGNFKAKINLNEGLNDIEIKAISKLNKEKIIKKTVQYVLKK